MDPPSPPPNAQGRAPQVAHNAVQNGVPCFAPDQITTTQPNPTKYPHQRRVVQHPATCCRAAPRRTYTPLDARKLPGYAISLRCAKGSFLRAALAWISTISRVSPPPWTARKWRGRCAQSAQPGGPRSPGYISSAKRARRGGRMRPRRARQTDGLPADKAVATKPRPAGVVVNAVAARGCLPSLSHARAQPSVPPALRSLRPLKTRFHGSARAAQCRACRRAGQPKRSRPKSG